MRIRLSWSEISRPARVALAIGAAGLLVRALVVALSIGSNDALTWETYGEIILHGDLMDTYRVYKAFNHPPLPGYLAMVAYDLFRVTGIRFQVFFKIAPVLADVLTGWLLYGIWQRHGRGTLAVALYAGSVVAILGSAYHCNTDSIAAALSLLAVVLWDRGRPLAAGLALGAALDVKLIPAPLVLVLALLARDPRTLGRYLAGLALAALPFVPVVLLAPAAFYRNALAYNSLANPWGLVAFLEAARETTRFAPLADALFTRFRAHGRYLVLLVPLAFALLGRRHRWSATRLGAITMMLFLLLTPGFSVHYLVYAVPLLFAVDLRAAAVFSAVGGACALAHYLAFWTGTLPWFSDFTVATPPLAVLLGLCTWLVLARATYTAARTGLSVSP